MPRDQSHMMLTRRRQGILRDLYRRHWPELCRYVSRTFGAGPPDPEDVAQTAFSKFAALKDPDSIHNPRAFLYRTAHNIVISDKRRARTRQTYVDDALHRISPPPGCYLTAERVLLEKEQLRIVQAALADMPRKRRRLLLLNRIHGLSFVEIGRRLHMSPQNVGKHVRRAVAELEAALKAADHDPASHLEESHDEF